MSDTRNCQIVYPNAEVDHIEFNEGYVEVYHAHKSYEAQRTIEAAIILAKLGYQVRLLPIDNTPHSKNPGAYFIREGLKVEFKRKLTSTRLAIEKSVKHASKQATRFVLHVLSDVTRLDLIAGIKSKFFFFQCMELLWLVWQREVYQFVSGEIFSGTVEQKIK